MLKKRGEDNEELLLDPITDIPFDKIEPVYTVAGTYDNNNGKFSAIFGNVAIVDCSYFFFDLLNAV